MGVMPCPGPVEVSALIPCYMCCLEVWIIGILEAVFDLGIFWLKF